MWLQSELDMFNWTTWTTFTFWKWFILLENCKCNCSEWHVHWFPLWLTVVGKQLARWARHRKSNCTIFCFWVFLGSFFLQIILFVFILNWPVTTLLFVSLVPELLNFIKICFREKHKMFEKVCKKSGLINSRGLNQHV